MADITKKKLMIAHPMFPFGTVVQTKVPPLNRAHRAYWMAISPTQVMCLGNIVTGQILNLNKDDLSILEPVPEMDD